VRDVAGTARVLFQSLHLVTPSRAVIRGESAGAHQ
jgi:hypothetical protein